MTFKELTSILSAEPLTDSGKRLISLARSVEEELKKRPDYSPELESAAVEKLLHERMFAGSPEELSAGIQEREFIAGAAAQVEGFLQDRDWKWKNEENRYDYLRTYRLRFCMKNCSSLMVRITIDARKKSCGIRASFPVGARETSAYPLCRKIADMNSERHYGALKYDETNGELFYEYSFRIGHGLYEDDFFAAFGAVIETADECYEEIRRYADGNFSREEKRQILIDMRNLAESFKE
ncbi:MAG: YbjN domain-containing protein [Lachnospiraceae bacterium]|nr:YbjN domain-containing protein [Lachnospiraceae bacterium]